MKVIKRNKIKLKNPVPVYDLVMTENNPCFGLSAGVISHNTISPQVGSRKALVPHHDNQVWFHIDFSQAELVMLSYFSQDPDMMEVFRSGGDMHRFVASMAFGKPEDEITSEERRAAKAISFGVVYGQAVENLAIMMTGGDVPKAQALMDAFFVAFPTIRDWMRDRKIEGRDTGYVHNIFGAKIPVVDPNVPTFDKGAIDRHAVNYAIQSSSSMVAGSSMYDLTAAFKDTDMEGTSIGFVHDSLDHTVDIDNMINFIKLVKVKMQDEVFENIGTPMKVDYEVGINARQLCDIKSFEEDGEYLTLEMSGRMQAVMGIIDKFSNYSKVYLVDNVDVLSTKTKFSSWRESFMSNGGYNSEWGYEHTDYHVVLKLKRK